MLDLIDSLPFTRRIRAAQYLRVSTDHQRYSIPNQSAAIALYAAAHNIGIVRSFIDYGKSGTTTKGRLGLQELIRLVESGDADFEQVIVYDVSRWGRFSNVDEAAHYEFRCKRAGISVHYCAEQFQNDNSSVSALLKALKRFMSSEYSRELATKVLAGQRRIASLGFWIPGRTPFGYQRAQVSKDGKFKGTLQPGEHKSLKTDRIVLILGGDGNVRDVRRIFDLCTKESLNSGQIAKIMNAEGRSFHRHRWNSYDIDRILANPVYVGTNLFCRARGSRCNPREDSIVREGAFPPIIEPRQFHAARDVVNAHKSRFTEEVMLQAVRNLWKEKGTLSEAIINASKGKVPGKTALQKHFGGLTNVYRRIGFQPRLQRRQTIALRSLNNHLATILESIAIPVRNSGGSIRSVSLNSALINESISARIIFSRPLISRTGHTVWPLVLKHKRKMDVLIVCRLKPDLPLAILDYYVIPKGAELKGSYRISERKNPDFIDIYRMETLDSFTGLFARLTMKSPS